MKIVTYNVNGLRSRVSQHGSLLKLLNSLDADIICIQETKLSRQELSTDLAMAEGYEAFFTCSRISTKGRVSYSGVATFCRVKSAFSSSEVALPLAAQEGFTGLLENPKRGDAIIQDFLPEMPVKMEGLEQITKDDLLKLDSEGRCIITDHGHFVLFNIYGPRADPDDAERLQFKLKFFQTLQVLFVMLLDLLSGCCGVLLEQLDGCMVCLFRDVIENMIDWNYSFDIIKFSVSHKRNWNYSFVDTIALLEPLVS